MSRWLNLNAGADSGRSSAIRFRGRCVPARVSVWWCGIWRRSGARDAARWLSPATIPKIRQRSWSCRHTRSGMIAAKRTAAKSAGSDRATAAAAAVNITMRAVVMTMMTRIDGEPRVNQPVVQAARASSSEEKTPNKLRMPTILKVLEAKLEGLTSFVSPPT